MGRKEKTPTDREAGALAQTARHPHNIEEARGHEAPAEEAATVQTEEKDEDRGGNGQAGGTAPSTGPGEKAGIFTRIGAALTTGFCETCQRPNVEDPKNVHECARCRSKVLPHVLKHQKEKLQKKAADEAAKRNKKA